MLLAVASAVSVGLASGSALAGNGLVLVDSHLFTWTDPASSGVVLIREEVYTGCSDGHGGEMTFKYHVLNQSYDPIPGTTNGFSGFQIRFPGPVPELHQQTSPGGRRPVGSECVQRRVAAVRCGVGRAELRRAWDHARAGRRLQLLHRTARGARERSSGEPVRDGTVRLGPQLDE